MSTPLQSPISKIRREIIDQLDALENLATSKAKALETAEQRYLEIERERDGLNRDQTELAARVDELKAQLANQATAPRVITADELREGQAIAVLNVNGIYQGGGRYVGFSHSALGAVRLEVTTGRHGGDSWHHKGTDTIVLLEEAPAEEPEQGVTVQQLEDAEPGSQYIAGDLISTKRTTGLWGMGILHDPLTSEELLRIAEHQGLDGYIDPQEPAPAKIGDTITTEEQVDALPNGTMLRGAGAWKRGGLRNGDPGLWWLSGCESGFNSADLVEDGQAFTVLHLPEEEGA